MNFKIELFMLFAAIFLFTICTICYSLSTGSGITLSIKDFPYRTYAIPFLSGGSALMAIATISYSKRNKTINNSKFSP